MVKIETRCRIPIWRTFGRITWHVIPEPRIILQGAATWWIHCLDSRATCPIAGCSHLAKSTSWSCHIARCNNSIRYIENRFSPIFLFFLCSLGLPPTKEEVNAIGRVCLTVCLSVCYQDYSKTRGCGFGWNFACRQMSGHGRTDWLLSLFRIIVRIQEPDLHRILEF